MIDHVARDELGGISGEICHLMQSGGPIIRRRGGTDPSEEDGKERQGSHSGGKRIKRELSLDEERLKHRRIRFEMEKDREEESAGMSHAQERHLG